MQVRRLKREQSEQLHLLTFVDEVMQWQADRGRAALAEGPSRWPAWSLAPMLAIMERAEFTTKHSIYTPMV